MCKYTKENQLGKCGDVKTRKLTADQQKQMVEAHNAKRRIIAKGEQSGQPAAANMIKLVRPLIVAFIPS
jgi:hypothetical protein